MRPPVFHRMYGYNPDLLPNRHLASLDVGVENIQEAQKRSGLTIGYPGWGLIYHLLLCHLDRGRQEILVETGTNQGCTTIMLAQALVDAGCDGHVLTFELDPGNAAVASRNHIAAGLSDRITIHTGDSRQTLGPALSALSGIRFAFLDASHMQEDVLKEFEILYPHLAEDAIVLFDNTYRIADPGEDQRVNGALPILLDRYGGQLVNLAFVSWFTPGLAIWQRRPVGIL